MLGFAIGDEDAGIVENADLIEEVVRIGWKRCFGEILLPILDFILG